jgi:transcription antitermination factor NusG
MTIAGAERRRETAWFALITRTRHEKAVYRQLADKGIPAYLPTVNRWSRWTDRTRQIETPLFPGYCFASFNPDEPLPVLMCAGVLGIVSFGAGPVPIAPEELQSIRLLLASDAVACEPHALLQEGDTVEVIGGPLRGVVGRLLHKDLTRASVVVSIHVIGRGVRVQVRSDDIVLVRRREGDVPARLRGRLVRGPR